MTLSACSLLICTTAMTPWPSQSEDAARTDRPRTSAVSHEIRHQCGLLIFQRRGSSLQPCSRRSSGSLSSGGTCSQSLVRTGLVMTRDAIVTGCNRADNTTRLVGRAILGTRPSGRTGDVDCREPSPCPLPRWAPCCQHHVSSNISGAPRATLVAKRLGCHVVVGPRPGCPSDEICMTPAGAAAPQQQQQQQQAPPSTICTSAGSWAGRVIQLEN